MQIRLKGGVCVAAFLRSLIKGPVNPPPTTTTDEEGAMLSLLVMIPLADPFEPAGLLLYAKQTDDFLQKRSPSPAAESKESHFY